jgi:hemolysin activation/secretion protein
LEVRTPQFSPAGTASAWRIGGLLFVDAATLTLQQPVAPQVASHSLRGTGFGLRLTAPGGLTVEADAAWALVDGDTTLARARRFHARAVWGY